MITDGMTGFFILRLIAGFYFDMKEVLCCFSLFDNNQKKNVYRISLPSMGLGMYQKRLTQTSLIHTKSQNCF